MPSFTYDLLDANDITRVRFHVGDTSEDTALFPDDEITFAISEAGSWEGAVLFCIQNILARMNSDPDFTFDELEIDQDSQRKHWLALMQTKRDEFGIAFKSKSSLVVATRWPTRTDDT